LWLRGLAATAAERADRVHLLIHDLEPGLARRHERARGAGLHALAAGDAGRSAHRVVLVEHDLRVLAAERVADDVVHLLFAAGTQAARALDAGIQVHRDGGVGNVRLGLFPGLEPWFSNSALQGPHGDLVIDA